MGYRRRRLDKIEDLVAALATLLFGLTILSRAFRQWVLILAVVFFLGLMAFVIYRLYRRRRDLVDLSPIKVYNYDDVPEVTVAPSSRPPPIIPPVSPRHAARSTPSLLDELSKLFRSAPGRVDTSPPPRLVDQLHTIDWFQFEKIIAHVYGRFGYRVIRRGGAKPDGGIDLLIEKDGQRTGVQCKQWKAWKVGVKDVREFLGALAAARLQKGIYITIRGYTEEARLFASQNGIQILDETRVLVLLNEVGASYDPEAQAILRDSRKFCPKCEAEMILRTSQRGPNAGVPFWGCSRFPRCRYIFRLQAAPQPPQDDSRYMPKF